MNGAFITEVASYADFAAVRIVALGADEFTFLPGLDRAMDLFRKVHNLKRVEFYGRRGWEKKLPNYKLNRIMMVRE